MGTIVIDNKYRLDALVAEGGQGALWRATHRLGSTFALKLCAPHLAADPAERQRFFDEGYISTHIPSAHVLPAIDDGLTLDGAPYVVFPWVDGENAEERRLHVGGRLPPCDVLMLADQALDALGAAHEAGIVHRDLKAANLLIANRGHLSVIDWAAASYRAHLGARTVASSFPPITLEYTAPEQARGEEATPRSDIFGLGATMHALLAGRSPREAPSALATLIDAATRELPPVRDVAPDVVVDVAIIIDRATAFDAADRYATAALMRADIRGVWKRLHAGVGGPSQGGVADEAACARLIPPSGGARRSG